MDLLKLAALDEDDLKVVSAHVQDAVLRVEDFTWLPGESRFALALNRFVWETPGGFFRRRNERRRAALTFDRVTAVRSTGIDRQDRDEVLSILAIRFLPGEAPGGAIEILFSGQAAVRLEVEVVEVRLADLGPAWDTPSRPTHGI